MSQLNDTLPIMSTHIQSPISVPRRLPNNSPIISIPNVTRDFAPWNVHLHCHQ